MFKLCFERRPFALWFTKIQYEDIEKYQKQFLHDKSSFIDNYLMNREPMELIKKLGWLKAFGFEVNETSCIILEFLKADEVFLGNAV